MQDTNLLAAEVAAPARTVEVVTLEIKTLHNQAQSLMLSYAIEIGRRLVEVKELLPHGEWGEYLKTQVEYSQSTANNFMRIFEEYGATQQSLFGAEANSQTLGNLPYTKALTLLAIPSDERETFVTDNDVENISTRELKELIRERDEAKKRTEELEAQMSEAETGRDAAKDEIRRLELELDELSNHPVEVAVEVDEAAVAEAAAAAKREAEGKLKAKLQKARDDKTKAEAELTRARELQSKAEDELKKEREAAAQAVEKARSEQAARVESLEKQLKVAVNQDVTTFKFYFDAVQEDFNRMLGCLGKVQGSGDGDNHEKLTGAVKALLAKWDEAL